MSEIDLIWKLYA